MQEIVYHSNFEIENKYWWFVARNQIVKDIFEKICKIPKNSDVLDVGCGTGGFASKLINNYNVIGIDKSDLALDYSKRRGIKHLYNCYLDKFPAKDWNIKAITILDVIEHIEDDVAVVKQCYSILPDNGYIVATVPAYKWMWSHHDVIHQHYRRYNQKQFNELLTRAGFKIEYSTYFNSILFLPAFLKRLVEKIFGTKNNNSPVDEVPDWLNSIFTKMFEMENSILPNITFPFGLSILTVAKKIK